MMSRLVVVGVCVIALAAAPEPCAADAPGASQPASVGAIRSGPRGPAAVTGIAWSAGNEPVANASVRLRNILTGAVVASAVANAAGEFRFENVSGNATYVVELLDDNGGVRAVGPPVTVAPGATVATLVRLNAPALWFTGMFGNAAAAAVATAASLGITAVTPTAPPISATR